MDETIIAAMKAEEAELKAKLGTVRAFLELYAPGDRMALVKEPRTELLKAASSLAFANPENIVTDGPIIRKRPNGYAENIRAIAADLVRQSLDPVPTRAVVEELQRRNVEIRGQDKISAVSALLSRSETFRNADRQGWVLAEPDTGESSDENGAAEATPDEEGAPTPSANDSREDIFASLG